MGQAYFLSNAVPAGGTPVAFASLDEVKAKAKVQIWEVVDAAAREFTLMVQVRFHIIRNART